MKYVSAMTIAGSDSGGGAGIQADIKTMSAIGVYATSVITCVTAQNTQSVLAIQNVSPELVKEQIRAVMEDICPQAIKIGMVNDIPTIHAIADALSAYSVNHLIVDPVMVSTSGCRLMEVESLAIYKERILPMTTLLTPNIPEAEILSDVAITDEESMNRAAERIRSYSDCGVLIKGGHANGNHKTDCLYLPNQGRRTFTTPSVQTTNTHGTGCTLSAAITSYLALGHDRTDAIHLAKQFVYHALQKGATVRTGKGYGPVNHFFHPQPLRIL